MPLLHRKSIGISDYESHSTGVFSLLSSVSMMCFHRSTRTSIPIPSSTALAIVAPNRKSTFNLHTANSEYRRVPEPLLRHLEVRASKQEQCCDGVSEFTDLDRGAPCTRPTRRVSS